VTAGSPALHAFEMGKRRVRGKLGTGENKKCASERNKPAKKKRESLAGEERSHNKEVSVGEKKALTEERKRSRKLEFAA